VLQLGGWEGDVRVEHINVSSTCDTVDVRGCVLTAEDIRAFGEEHVHGYLRDMAKVRDLDQDDAPVDTSSCWAYGRPCPAFETCAGRLAEQSRPAHAASVVADLFASSTPSEVDMPFTGITSPHAPAERAPVPLTSLPVAEMTAVNSRSAAGLAALGIVTVGDVLAAVDAGRDLTAAAGVGAKTAENIAAEVEEVRRGLV
jgi:hypothetical protein